MNTRTNLITSDDHPDLSAYTCEELEAVFNLGEDILGSIIDAFHPVVELGITDLAKYDDRPLAGYAKVLEEIATNILGLTGCEISLRDGYDPYEEGMDMPAPTVEAEEQPDPNAAQIDAIVNLSPTVNEAYALGRKADAHSTCPFDGLRADAWQTGVKHAKAATERV